MGDHDRRQRASRQRARAARTAAPAAVDRAAYAVIAGMLELVFVLDHTRGRMLAVLTLMLTVFALDVPMLLGFSVARYAGRR